MKILILFIASLLFSISSFSSEFNNVEKFATYLIEIIESSNVIKFRGIDCVKISCGSMGVEYIFGDNESSRAFNEIMSKDDIAFKIFGPYTVEKEYADSTYSIVFYSKSNSPFNSEGLINLEVGYAELYRTFLQTQVTVLAGKVLFQRVPFYIESHHPYAGDYG